MVAPSASAKMPLTAATSPLAGEVAAVSGANPAGGGAIVPLVPLIGAEPNRVVPAVRPIRKAGDPFTLDLPGGAKMAFAWCPPGTFLMGSPESEDGRGRDEQQHEVRLTRGFYCGVHPVTQEERAGAYGTDPKQIKGTNLPMESVSWSDAQAFGRKVLEMTGTAVRLPTEAEWEYACRGGTTTPFYWGNELNGTQANCDGNHPYGTSIKGPSLNATSRVGSFAKKFPHPWGLTDVHGNVWEWCQDWYDAKFYVDSPKDDPECRAGGERKLRVMRGGTWSSLANSCRAAFRIWWDPVVRTKGRGFRVVFNVD